MINRDLTQIAAELRKKGKAIVITGPRQVGKTTLLKALFGNQKNVLWLDGDDATIRERLKNAGTAYLKTLVADNRIVVIDEAQRIHEVGLIGKQLVDQMPGVELFITGSSALELSGMTNEPMTGRKWSLQLYPLSFREMVRHQGLIERLLKLLAFQIGQQVSNHELAIHTGLDVSTVERYIDLLEKAFVVFRVPSFQRNKRNELKKSRKIYFVDNGIRNAIIEQWSPVDMRADAGMLWENWMMSERRKLINNEQASVSTYFWRTTAQQEVDLIEESASTLKAIEFKWNEKKKGSVSVAFTNAYPEASSMCITPKNFESFLLEL